MAQISGCWRLTSPIAAVRHVSVGPSKTPNTTLLPNSAAYKWRSHFLRWVHSYVALIIAEYTETDPANVNPEPYEPSSVTSTSLHRRGPWVPVDHSPTSRDREEFCYWFRMSKRDRSASAQVGMKALRFMPTLYKDPRLLLWSIPITTCARSPRHCLVTDI